MEQKEKMIYCNMCGKPICIEVEESQPDSAKSDANGGYSSGKDGMNHQINLCEDCYDEMLDEFQMLPSEMDDMELS